MSTGHASEAVDSNNRSTGKRRFSGRETPALAIVLTLVGDFVYLNFGIGLFIGLSVSGLLLYWTTVLFITTVGVLCATSMMILRPKLHLIWGGLVLALSAWAITADGNFLHGSYEYASSIVGPIAILGTILWSIPLILVLVGGVLALHWKPPAAP